MQVNLADDLRRRVPGKRLPRFEWRLKVLLVDEYTLGLAAIHRALSAFPEMDFIVTGGIWNGYTWRRRILDNNTALCF